MNMEISNCTIIPINDRKVKKLEVVREQVSGVPELGTDYVTSRECDGYSKNAFNHVHIFAVRPQYSQYRRCSHVDAGQQVVWHVPPAAKSRTCRTTCNTLNGVLVLTLRANTMLRMIYTDTTCCTVHKVLVPTGGLPV